MRIDKCAPGSPDGCIVSNLKVEGYSAGQVVRVTKGKKVSKSTEENSCPPGWKIWSPRNENDWKVVYNKLGKNIHNYPRKPKLIVDVTRSDNGCGGCGNYKMNSKDNKPAGTLHLPISGSAQSHGALPSRRRQRSYA